MSERPRTEVVDATPLDVSARVGEMLQDGYCVAMMAGHEDPDQFRIVYVLVRAGDDRRCEVVLRTPRDRPEIPSLASQDYAVGRFEREIRDLYGITPVGHPLPEVEGDGVYEVPVGPVHAGLIEPGHFRFSVVGETILHEGPPLVRLPRHREAVRRPPPSRLHRAYRTNQRRYRCRSHPGLRHRRRTAAGIEVAEEDRIIRAMLLELERIHNHVADLGALANDVGFGIVNTHAQRLRETMLRLNKATTGHRLLRGAVTIGGARLTALPDLDVVATVAREVEELRAITLGNSTVRDRFTGTAVLSREAALSLGTLGCVARASGVDIDARKDHPFVELGEPFEVVLETGGDVASRYLVRARELAVSASLIASLVQRLHGGAGTGAARMPSGVGSGLGLVEGWRGTVAHRVELDDTGRLSRAKVVDPSFFKLARPARRAHRHDRPGLSAGQQELQPVLRRQRPLERRQGRLEGHGEDDNDG